MADSALGYLETAFLSITAVAADRDLKAGNVTLLGFEPTGNEMICVRFSGASIADLESALASGEAEAKRLGATAKSALLTRPHPSLHHLNDQPNFINPLYGGRDELRPTDFPANRTMNTNQAIGILETQGLTAILQATDAMLKAANVELVGKEKIGAAYVTIIIRGDVAAVKAALEAGEQAVGNLGKVIAAQVIARPHESLLRLLPS